MDDVRALMSCGRRMDRTAAVARVALERRDPPAACARYLEALDKAVQSELPLFTTEAYERSYRSASANGQWLAISLITAAEREGDGATRLWSLAACSDDEEERELLKRHAVDESRHALAYLALLDLTFPGAVSPEFRAEMDQLSPHFAMGQEPRVIEGSPYARTPSIDDFIQMNIAEIRTTFHHLMQRPALAHHCPPDNVARATRLLDSVLEDELDHIAYSAVLVEKRAERGEGGDLQAHVHRRLCDFNRLTSSEVGQLIFD